MGLFDRFRSTGDHRANIDKTKTEDPVATALRLIEEGNATEETGQLQQAMQYYEAAIRTAPQLPRAHMNRGNILLATSDPEGAITAYMTALELDPDYAAAHYNLGHAHLSLKRYIEAQAAYKKAICLKEDFVDAHVALGVVQEDLNSLEEAANCYRKALALAPDYAEVHDNLGTVLGKLDRLHDAASSYRKALALNPELIETHFKLGQTLRVLNQTDAAIACFYAVLKRTPNGSDAHFSLGMALKELGQLDSAAKSLCLAVANDPNNPDKHVNLGDIFTELGLLDKAIASYEHALEIKPDHAVAHINLGNVMLALNSFDDAIAHYRQAIDIQPDFAAAYNNLGSTLLSIGYPIEALTNTRRAMELMPDLAPAQSNIVFIENSIAHKSPPELLDEAKKYGEIVASKARTFTYWSNDPNPDRNLRIGFVSADLRDHPVGHFVEGVLHSLASSAGKRLEIHAYTTFNCSDAMSQRIKACCHGWNSAAHISDEVLANKIYSDKIDILIDLSGHTAHNRLSIFAWKSAPIQVTWLGYLGTTGVSSIDYLIADAWTLPETEECNFTETIWRLPESYLCFTPPQSPTPVSSLPALQNGHVTFGCFNNITKISDEVITLWARILIEIPDSRLVLKAKQFTQASVQQKMRDRFSVHGVGGERLTLMEQVPRREYLTPYQQIDIALDPFPYPGITTSVESLWMGVPVLTLAGKSFISRQGVGLLNNAGLTDWIATSQDDYVARAKQHASNLTNLANLRKKMRQQVLTSPIFDTHRFAIHFDAALRNMWKKWCDTHSVSTRNNPSLDARSSSLISPKNWTSINSAYSWQSNNNSSIISPSNAPSKSYLNLHIGGKQPKEGWKILNSQSFEGVDYVGDIRDLSAFDDACCQNIYASHVMEHVSQKDFLPTLKGIHRILCDGGEFYFSVPDLEVLCRLFNDPKLDGTQRYHIMRMMFGGQQDEFDFHFIGLTAEFMTDFFKSAGFSQVKRVASLGLFNDTSNYEPYGVAVSLNMIATK